MTRSWWKSHKIFPWLTHGGAHVKSPHNMIWQFLLLLRKHLYYCSRDYTMWRIWTPDSDPRTGLWTFLPMTLGCCPGSLANKFTQQVHSVEKCSISFFISETLLAFLNTCRVLIPNLLSMLMSAGCKAKPWSLKWVQWYTLAQPITWWELGLVEDMFRICLPRSLTQTSGSYYCVYGRSRLISTPSLILITNFPRMIYHWRVGRLSM